jgi:hypothetical protein
MIFQANGDKQAKVISDKINFKPQLFRRDKEGQSILIKGTIHQEEITIANLHVPNFGASNFIKQKLLD